MLLLEGVQRSIATKVERCEERGRGEGLQQEVLMVVCEGVTNPQTQQ